MFQVYKLSRKSTQPENMCGIIFEKVKGGGKAVNGTGVYSEAAFEVFLQNSQENICAEISFLIKLITTDLKLH